MEVTTLIRSTNDTTHDGKPIVELKIGGETKRYYVDEANGNMVEYDDTWKAISYTWSIDKGEDDERTIRTETKKHLEFISNGRILGFHEYTTPEDADTKTHRSIVIWSKKKGMWVITIKKGLADLSVDDIVKLNSGIATMGWNTAA